MTIRPNIVGIVLFVAVAAIFSSAQAISDVERFKSETVFWKQIDIGQQIVAKGDRIVLSDLEPLLKSEDRHVRANAAYVFGAFNDDRGLAILLSILSDYSDRPQGQGRPGGNFSVKAQIVADRYYAVHVLGLLKNKNAISVLVPLLKDEDLNYAVPWSLAQIGDAAAIEPLIEALHDKNPDVRFTSISALETLNARQAIPELRNLLDDHETIHFGKQLPVSQAAAEALQRFGESK